MPHTRRRRGTTRPPRALKRRAPRKKRRRKPAPAAVVSTRAYSPGRVVGSQSDSFTAPKVIFFRRLRTGALSTPCSAPTTVGRPARLKRACVAAFLPTHLWSTARGASACKRVRVLRVSYRVLNCKKRRARGKLQDGRPRMPAAPASPRTASSLERRYRSRHRFARARRLTANQQQHQSPWRTRSPPDPPKLL